MADKTEQDLRVIMKRIRDVGPRGKKLRDIRRTLPRLAPSDVARALGAEASDLTLQQALAPITLMAVREELARRLQSSGGRPALSGTTRRAKIPLGEEEWLELEELAAAISSPGFAPSAGQVASVLLRLSARTVASQLSESSSPSDSPLARELAARASGD